MCSGVAGADTDAPPTKHPTVDQSASRNQPTSQQAFLWIYEGRTGPSQEHAYKKRLGLV